MPECIPIPCFNFRKVKIEHLELCHTSSFLFKKENGHSIRRDRRKSPFSSTGVIFDHSKNRI